MGFIKTNKKISLFLTVLPRRQRRQGPPQRHEVPLPSVERQQEVPVGPHERLGVEARRPRGEVEAAGRGVRRERDQGRVARDGDPEEVEARVVLELGKGGADAVQPPERGEPQQRQPGEQPGRGRGRGASRQGDGEEVPGDDGGDVEEEGRGAAVVGRDEGRGGGGGRCCRRRRSRSRRHRRGSLELLLLPAVFEVGRRRRRRRRRRGKSRSRSRRRRRRRGDVPCVGGHEKRQRDLPRPHQGQRGLDPGLGRVQRVRVEVDGVGAERELPGSEEGRERRGGDGEGPPEPVAPVRGGEENDRILVFFSDAAAVSGGVRGRRADGARGPKKRSSRKRRKRSSQKRREGGTKKRACCGMPDRSFRRPAGELGANLGVTSA